ncbi:MAG: NUDIX hydrolase, partial [Actinobacteria bacterium]|nr:NUDIX hydrolase [Actinomycetota bacterium]
MARSEPSWPPGRLYVAVDVAVVTVLGTRLRVLLVRRPYEPFLDHWALPGSFSGPDETLDETARRALDEKAGVREAWLEQLGTYDQPRRGDAPGRDPRGRVVSVAYIALVHPEDGPPQDAEGTVAWFDVTALPGRLAFDHDTILADGLARLRAKTRYAPVAFQLLPDEFTLRELQRVYEVLVGERFDVRNFRRDLRSAGVVDPTGGTKREGPGRPAALYRYVPGTFAVTGDERRVA